MKKVLALVLAFAMILGCTAMAFAGSQTSSDYGYADDDYTPAPSTPTTPTTPATTETTTPVVTEPTEVVPEAPAAVDSTGKEVAVVYEEPTTGEVAVAVAQAIDTKETTTVVDLIKTLATIAPTQETTPADGTKPAETPVVITEPEALIAETKEAVKELFKEELKETLAVADITKADDAKVEAAVAEILETFEPAKVVDIEVTAAAEDNPVDVSFPVSNVRLTSKVIALHQAKTGWEVVPAKVIGIGQVSVTLKSCSPVVVLVADDGCAFGDYTDLNPLDWYHDGLCYMLQKGYMGGIGNNKFNPTGLVTRAEMATSLYKLAKAAKVEATHSFTDITADWYKDAVAWAYANKIVGGSSDTTFSPADLLTREQAVTFMYNYAKAMGKDVTKTSDISKATDIAKVSSWAKTAMEWAVAEGIVSGTASNALTLNPQGTMDRASLAVLLANYIQK